MNWEYLKTLIVLPSFQKIHTGLNEVKEILPAECLEITPFERKGRFVWNPVEISQTDVIEDPDEAATLLRDTVRSTIGALTGCYDCILHNIGGLDSSIALACMAQVPRPPKITCTTFFTKSPQGEERFFSRQVPKRFGIPLVEWELDARNADLEKIFSMNKLVNPPRYSDVTNLSGEILALAKEIGAQAIFTGNGGDNVFFQPPRNLGALDYVRRHGFDKHSLKVLMEASRYGRQSIFSSFRGMLRERFFPAPCFSSVFNAIYEGPNCPIANPEFIGDDQYERFLHPLLIPKESIPKGKYMHILISALYYMDYYDRWDATYFGESLHVYQTQPIVEACLRIPIWILTYGGIDRGLARKAFRNDLPPDIVMRRSKSTPAPYYQSLFEYNIGFLREVLLDGTMVREKILIRDKLEAALKRNDFFLHVHTYQIFVYLTMEIWLRSWIERLSIHEKHIDTSV